MKNINAPNSAPDILAEIFLKNFKEINPIKTTLPQVNNTVPWIPIIKSVSAKQNKSAGKNFKPNIAGI